MIRLFRIALIASLVLAATAQAAGYRYLKPASFDQDTRVVVSGKTRHYFVLEGDHEIEVTIKGPSKLKVMSRLAMPNSHTEPEYKFKYYLDEAKKPREIAHRTKASDKAEIQGQEGIIGVLRSHVINVPRGKHTYRFRLPKDSQDIIYTRFSQKTNEFTGGTPVVAMTPHEFTSSIDLASREVYYTYYRVSSKDHAVLKLVGPATLKVLSRIEYEPDMLGEQKWKVQVLEDGSPKRTYNLSANKSEVSAYRDESSLVPSRAEIFYVEVPEGEHTYEFKLPDNHRTSIFRFLLPKSQLDLQ